jgi:hypothetical protein
MTGCAVVSVLVLQPRSVSARVSLFLLPTSMRRLWVGMRGSTVGLDIRLGRRAYPRGQQAKSEESHG